MINYNMSNDNYLYSYIFWGSLLIFMLSFICFLISGETKLITLEVALTGTAMSLISFLAIVGVDFLFRRFFD